MDGFVVKASWVVLFFQLMLSDQFGEVEGWDNVISWDDMRLDEHDYVMVSRRMRRDDHKWDFVALEDQGGRNPNRFIVVDGNGRGDSATVQGAVDMVPESNSQRVKIYVLPGIYREKVVIPASKPYISLIGNQNQSNQTVITWGDKASDIAKDGTVLGTYRSASVTVLSDYFCASGITFENSVNAVVGGIGMQAVALRIAGDKAMFNGVRILGTQDTLLDDIGSHYFYQSYIQGTVDFIFGRARSIYKDCIVHSATKTYGAIAAHHRDSPYDDTGFSFINCTINGSGKVLLGRAWGNYSRIIYSYCDIDDIISPPGWSDWGFPSRDRTAVFGEYKCRGKGADRTYRAPWSKSLSYYEAKPFLDMGFISAEKWLTL
ncbi:Pectinesterase [Heracleum sosnowskyi]|uniref:Pectinesterase n=1 Tax=Heracleum sosnowskyi TaxID=360622 RepID=A0AAD8JJT0_9APIA|nr:Pectinesterase [Heracleum sosnowskyi]